MTTWLSRLIAEILAHLATTLTAQALKRAEANRKTAEQDEATDARLERFKQAFKEGQNDPDKLKSAISDFIRGGMH